MQRRGSDIYIYIYIYKPSLVGGDESEDRYCIVVIINGN